MFHLKNQKQFNRVFIYYDRIVDLVISSTLGINAKECNVPFIVEETHHRSPEMEVSVNIMWQLCSSHFKLMFSKAIYDMTNSLLEK